jgi:5-hydroxyisourate hydrolase-like protein (transthyretin family)
MAGISTHVLDTVAGRPGAGMRIEFSKRIGYGYVLQKTVYTNADGRTDQPILTPAETTIGEYELRFFVEEYFRGKGGRAAGPRVHRGGADPLLDLRHHAALPRADAVLAVELHDLPR